MSTLPLPKTISSSGELDGDDLVVHLDFRVRLSDISNVEAEKFLEGTRREPYECELRAYAYKMYQSRRARGRLIDQSFLGEPAWDMLLALYSLVPRGELLTVTSLSHAAEVPIPTGLRWQQRLLDEGLIERARADIDKRRVLMRLTPNGEDLMTRILTRLYHINTPTPVDLRAVTTPDLRAAAA